VWEVLVDHSLEVPRDAAWDGLMSNATMFSNRPIHGGGILSNPLLEGILSACHVPVFAFPSKYHIAAFSFIRILACQLSFPHHIR
jgi:hypothetical protein